MAVPHILQVIPNMETGGAEQTALDVAQAVTARGWRSTIASSGGRLVSAIEENGGDHLDLPLASKNPVTMVKNARVLRKFMKDNDVSLVHARSRAPAWSALMACRNSKTPFVTTYHGAYGQKNAAKAFYNSVMARGDSVIANSNWTANLIETRHRVAKGRVVTIPRGTDFSKFTRDAIEPPRLEALREAWGVSDKNFVILQLARLTDWKGQKYLIEAAAKIVAQHPGVCFVLAGDPQGRDAYVADLRDMISAAGLQNHVLLTGHCEDPAAAMALADIMVSASTEPEAFGRTIVEAAALEVPVVATNIGGPGETILCPPDCSPDERTGWRVPPANASMLAEALSEIIALSAAKRGTVGARARAYCLKNYSLQQMCNATLSVYEKLLALPGN